MTTLFAILLFAGTLGLSFWASARVKRTYRRYAEVGTITGLTGAETAHRVMEQAGIRDVSIHAQEGMLSDHYDPIHKRLVLSEENYHGTSISAVAVAAHEAGHALQHAQAYAPLTWRMAAVGATSFASQVVLWLPLLGMVTGFVQTTTGMVLMAVGWGVIMLFNLVTLPVEFDASRRARLALGDIGAISSPEESAGVSRVLNAAALTHVAAFITSFAYLLWHLIPLLTGRSEE